MATTELKTRVFLRRDAEANYIADYTYGKGEVLFVDTADGLKAKIGDGSTAFKNLGYYNDIIIRGYFLNNKFYTDSTYTVECEKAKYHLYIDCNSATNGAIYTWDGANFNRDVKMANASTAGIMKLYSTSGQNTDGTMTQKVITDGVNAIKFAVDEQDTECLVLDLPWD